MVCFLVYLCVCLSVLRENRANPLCRTKDGPSPLRVCKSYSVSVGSRPSWAYLRGFCRIRSQQLTVNLPIRNAGLWLCLFWETVVPFPSPRAALSPCSHTRHQPLPLLWRSDLVEPECKRHSANARITGYTKLPQQQHKTLCHQRIVSKILLISIWGPQCFSSTYRWLQLHRNILIH